ncbi:MAG: S-layer homology domain-containing protein [Oscillospiraceae bacterium]|nr:S-layer homology domain-containing protein [Oscillospiraceae bacterium]
MKKRMFSILLCLALLAALLPTGLFGTVAYAEELYKTENVVVPDGWDYVEVSTAEELYEALEKHKNFENNYHPQPIFIRLMADIKHSANDLAKFDDSLVEAYIYTTTTFDLNGHYISMNLNESNDADNHTWYLLNLSLICDEGEDLTFRIVDSVGGGFFNLWANTYVDGPTTTVRIWSNNKAKVIIDGGVFRLFTNNTKAVGLSVIEGYGSVSDSGGYSLWRETQYFRSALALDNVDATINDGHFVAKCQIEDGLHGKTIRRYVSALGLDNSATGMLQINGGLFEGDAFAMYNYTWVDSEWADRVKFPTINGGTFKGGMMLVSGEGMATWKNIFGYDLNSTNKKLPISTVLYEGARMFIDGAALRANPYTTTLEDIAWPHEIYVQSGPMITAERINKSSLVVGDKANIYLKYNYTPDSVEIQEKVTTIRNGGTTTHWTKLSGANYIKLPTNNEYDYNAEIPSRTDEGERIVRVAATFGSDKVYSKEYTLTCVKTPDYAFTKQPAVTPKGEEAAHVSFNLNYPDKLTSISLWRDINGDHYSLVDKSEYNMLTPEYVSDGNYRIWFTDLYGAPSSAQEATYIVRLKYNNLAGGRTEVDSEKFTVKRDALEHHHVYPAKYNYLTQEGHGFLCTACGGHPSELLPHVSSGPAKIGVAEVCTVCGYQIAPAITNISVAVDELAAGKTPGEIAPTVYAPGARLYAYDWLDESGKTMSKFSTFEAGKTYTLVTVVTSVSALNDSITATVNGKDAQSERQWDDYNLKITGKLTVPEEAESENEVQILISIVEKVDLSKVKISLTTDKGTTETTGNIVIKTLNATKGSEIEVKAEVQDGYKFARWEIIDFNTGDSYDVTEQTYKLKADKRLLIGGYFTSETSKANPFTDVPDNSDYYYYEPILWAYYHEPQITTGTSADTFAPWLTCDRAQVVTFLWRAYGCPEPKSASTPFADLTQDWYKKAVQWAVEQGITNGTSDTTFSPDNACSVAEVITFLYRAAGSPGTGGDTWYSGAMNWAKTSGLVQNTSWDGSDPFVNCPRADIVTYLYRQFGK